MEAAGWARPKIVCPLHAPTLTRMMNQKKLKVAATSVASPGAVQVIYSSSAECLMQTVRTEGVMALYKGFIPNWLRLGPWNIIFFMTYEQLKKTY